MLRLVTANTGRREGCQVWQVVVVFSRRISRRFKLPAHKLNDVLKIGHARDHGVLGWIEGNVTFGGSYKEQESTDQLGTKLVGLRTCLFKPQKKQKGLYPLREAGIDIGVAGCPSSAHYCHHRCMLHAVLAG